MDNLRCKNCKYLKDYSLDGCDKCNNCGSYDNDKSYKACRYADLAGY